VDEHKAEPDFSFAISPQPPDVDPEITLRKGYPDDAAAAVRSVRLTEILFARYYNRKSPKYVIRGR
jgi:hypothetical protein